ncbi:sodium-independent anion transporter [Actinoplanes xinjiangensis]|uniref:sodium-independent anion transporter n=1 Tax=Actinoplanes xinjiangensis TaxID=512350 RepID=UPI0034460FC1
MLQLSEITDVRVVILRMSRVTTIDPTGAHVLADAINRLQRRGIVVLLAGITPGHEQVLATLGLAGQLRGDGHVFPDTPAAITHARAHVLHHDAADLAPAPAAADTECTGNGRGRNGQDVAASSLHQTRTGPLRTRTPRSVSMRLLLIGPPGSGKGTQAVHLAQHYGITSSFAIPQRGSGQPYRAHRRLFAGSRGYLRSSSGSPRPGMRNAAADAG